MACFVDLFAVLGCLCKGLHLVLEPLLLHNQLRESVALLEHVVFDVSALSMLLLQVLPQLLLLEHLIRALVDPILDSVGVDALLLLLLLLLPAALLRVFLCLLLEGLQLLNLLTYQLVSLLQVSLELVDSLVFVLDRLFKGQQVLVYIRLEFGEALFAELLRTLGIVPLLLHLRQLHLHGLQARLLLCHGLLDVVLLLLFLTLLVGELLLQDFHLLLVLLLDGLRRGVVRSGGRQVAPLVLLYAAHLRLDLLDTLSPSVLEELAQITLDLVHILLHSAQQLLLLLQAGRSAGLGYRSLGEGLVALAHLHHGLCLVTCCLYSCCTRVNLLLRWQQRGRFGDSLRLGRGRRRLSALCLALTRLRDREEVLELRREPVHELVLDFFGVGDLLLTRQRRALGLSPGHGHRLNY